jgi:hypothetical protein
VRVRHAPRNIGRPREEGVSNYAGRSTDAGDELLECMQKKVMNWWTWSSVRESASGGEAVLGGREWEHVEVDGRGRRRDGEGGQEARCRDECDLDLRAECGRPGPASLRV